jgi:phosphoribosylformimino-5-aminoimidazole carboxamide ribotide isomerase
MNRSTTFNIYPAIDLRQGKVVRLIQGDPNRQTIYAQNPAKTAQKWIEIGAKWLHVVNLDGAFGTAASLNLDALSRILEWIQVSKANVSLQWGGGIRSLEDVRRLLSLGVTRVIVGSAAVEKPEVIQEALQEFDASRIALAVDVKDQKVYIRGWVKPVKETPVELGQRFYQLGLRTCIFTDIHRDGGGTGLNIAATSQFSHDTGLEVIASGGVASLEDVILSKQAGLSGVIIGKALYDQKISLSAALAYQS